MKRTDPMAPLLPEDHHPTGTSRVREPGGATVSTRKVPRMWFGWIARWAAAFVALMTVLDLCWDRTWTSGQENLLVTLPERIMALALAPDGRWLATGGFHGAVVAWDVPRRRIDTEVMIRAGYVSALA